MPRNNSEKTIELNMIVDEFDIRVPIKESLRRGLIFGLQARPPIGIILGFFGYREKVINLLQILSHSTRAYIINAGGLPGFLIRIDVMNYLREADESGQLENARKG